MAAISAEIVGECGSSSARTARTSRASSIRPLRASQRGDSGIRNRTGMTKSANTTHSTSGTRHWTEPSGAKNSPKDTHSEIVIPPLMQRPSNMTKAPLCFVREHSVCQTGTAALMMPMAPPTNSLPMTNWARVKEEDSIASAMTDRTRPQNIVRKRPILSL